MKKSIKRSVGIRVAVALLAVLMFSVMMTVNILTIEGSQKQSASASDVLDRAQKAETAHYKWASNLSNVSDMYKLPPGGGCRAATAKSSRPAAASRVFVKVSYLL